MRRIVLHLADGSRIDLVTDEVVQVSESIACLGPARIGLHPSGLPEATSYACDDLWSSMLGACRGLEIVDGPPIITRDDPVSPVVALDDDENPPPSSNRGRVCTYCGDSPLSLGGECPELARCPDLHPTMRGEG